MQWLGYGFRGLGLRILECDSAEGPGVGCLIYYIEGLGFRVPLHDAFTALISRRPPSRLVTPASHGVHVLFL